MGSTGFYFSTSHCLTESIWYGLCMAGETSNGFSGRDFPWARSPSLQARGLLDFHHNQRHIVMLRRARRKLVRRAHQ